MKLPVLSKFPILRKFSTLKKFSNPIKLKILIKRGGVKNKKSPIIDIILNRAFFETFFETFFEWLIF